MIKTSSSRMAAGLGVDNSGEIWLPYQYCRDLHRLQHRETLQNTKGTACKTRVPDCNLLTFSVGQEADVYVRSVRLMLHFRRMHLQHTNQLILGPKILPLGEDQKPKLPYVKALPSKVDQHLGMVKGGRIDGWKEGFTFIYPCIYIYIDINK